VLVTSIQHCLAPIARHSGSVDPEILHALALRRPVLADSV